MNRNLIDFYRREVPNCEGATLEEIWCWHDFEWEAEHAFIQWLFPLRNESAFNPDAPLLDEETITLWHYDPELKENLRISYERWLRFCGIEKTESGLMLVNAKNYVWPHFNHNWLRVTRVLNSLSILGMKPDAEEFRATLFKAHEDKKIEINEITMQFWKGENDANLHHQW